MQKHYNYLTINLDLKTYKITNAKQGDSKSRYILVTLISNNSPYDLTGTSVKIYGIKEDKKQFFNNATITDAKNGQFEIELTSQALAVPGYLKMEILVLGANQERLSTSHFYINVEESIIDDAAIESTNEFKIWEQSLNKVEEWNNYFSETSGKLEEKYTERLNKFNEQFNTIKSEKADKNDLEVQKSRIDNFTTLKEGSTTGDAELIDGRVSSSGYLYENIGVNIRNISSGKGLNDYAISARKTSFFTENTNLLNLSALKKDTSLITTSGLEYTATNYYTSSFISVIEGEAYLVGVLSSSGSDRIASISGRICFYKASGEFISGQNLSGSEYIIPSTASLIKIAIQGQPQSGSFICLKNKFDGFERYDSSFLKTNVIKQKTDLTIKKQRKNIFDNSKKNDNKQYSNYSIGKNFSEFTIVDYTGRTVTEPIEVEEGTYSIWTKKDVGVISSTVINIFYFDSEMYLLKIQNATTLGGNVITINKNTKYIILTLNTSTASTIMITEGTAQPTYFSLYEEYSQINNRNIITEKEFNKWYGKTWSVYSDSIGASANSYISGKTTSPTYAEIVQENNKFDKFYGRGIGGSTFKYGSSIWWANADGSYNSRPTSQDDGSGQNTSSTQPSNTTEHNASFCSFDRIKTMLSNELDLICIWGGTNDFGSNVPIGDIVWSSSNIKDTVWVNSSEYNGGDFDITTFKGAVASTIMKIQSLKPNSVIVLISPPNGRSFKEGVGTKNDTSLDVNNLGLTLIDYCNAMKEVAQWFGIPFIDMFANGGINQFNRSLYLQDGVHPNNTKGKYSIARVINGALKNIEPMY